ncbi:hypothetical protein SPRG_12374 [Saprolegnia parasitica CBS 223.65]|uniref:Uncharacterized protein n=1 Tax=Saprolegnia parasitica (strain CBS 223.65) TaxID=695850 RepID=A0A067C4Y0_SAPPC|nr:hypothetical protein SPRG_12374 [Saprolegnia parasitica CBS 223.65]KDO21872.1 hypothetical protein SPRG_12374 [Saprolegnia parasitica CBS 223.65]|eukprot:XP_012207427.1 hypothetical protein SPRG_12374 [Saprolegnia parasitica CBS 223.65]
MAPLLRASTLEALALVVVSLLAFLRSVQRSRRPRPYRGCPPEVLEAIALYIPCPVACRDFLSAFPPSALTHSLRCLLELLDPAQQNIAVRWPAIYVNHKDRTADVLAWIAGARTLHQQLSLTPTTPTIFSATFLPNCFQGFEWRGDARAARTSIDADAHTPDAVASVLAHPDTLESLTLSMPDVCPSSLIGMLPNLTHLTTLSLQGHDASLHMSSLFQALCWLPHLKHLHLNHTGLDDAMATKVSRVVRCCSELEDLDLSGNQFSAAGVTSILSNLHTSPKLVAVNVTQNPYVLKDLVGAAPAVARLSATLKTISLRVDRDDMADAFPFLRALRNASTHRIVVMMVGSGTLSSDLAKEYHQLNKI